MHIIKPRSASQLIRSLFLFSNTFVVEFARKNTPIRQSTAAAETYLRLEMPAAD
jgi:hypothetical protein